MRDQILDLEGRDRLVEAVAATQVMLTLDRRLWGPAHDAVADSLTLLAALQVAQGDFAAAHQAAEEALAIRKTLHGEKDWRVTDGNLHLTSVNFLAGLPAGRFQDFLQALRLRRQVGELERRGEYGAAVGPAQKILMVFQEVLGKDHPYCAQRENILALLYLILGRCQDAEQGFQAAAAIAVKTLGADHPFHAEVLNNLGSLHYSRGRYDQAEAFFQQAAAIWDKTRYADYLLALNNLGELHRVKGDYLRAEEVLRKALANREAHAGGEFYPFAPLPEHRDVLYVDLGDQTNSNSLVCRGRALCREGPPDEHPYQARLRINLGQMYLARGNYAQAEAEFRQAVAIDRRGLGVDHPEYAKSLHNLGLLYLVRGDLDRAEPLLREASALWKRVLGDGHPEYAKFRHDLGLLYYARGDFPRAERRLLQAAAIWKRVLGDGHPEYAKGLHNLAVLAYAQGAYGRAEPLFEQSLTITRNVLGEGHPNYATGLYGLARLYKATGRPDRALASMDRCMAIEQANLGRVFSFSAEPAMRDYLATVNDRLDTLVSMALDDPANPAAAGSALAWTLRRKGIVFDTLCRFRDVKHLLDEGLAEDAKGVRKKITARMKELRALRQRLTVRARNPEHGVKADAFQHEMHSLSEDANRLEGQLYRDLSRLGPARLADSAAVDPGRVRACLPAGSALIEFLRVNVYDFKATGKVPHWQPARYVAFVLAGDGNGPIRLIDLGDAAAIEGGVRRVQQNVEETAATYSRVRTAADREEFEASEKDREQAFRQASRALYDRVFAHLGPALGAGTREVFLALDGELNAVPFEALVDVKDRYLLQLYQFVYLSTGRDLLRPVAAPGRGTVVFAGPDFTLQAAARRATAKRLLGEAPVPSGVLLRGLRGVATWGPLNGALKEADVVEQAFRDTAWGPVRSYRGAEALEEVFKSLRSPRGLHVATHGFFQSYQPQGPQDRWELLNHREEAFFKSWTLEWLAGAEDPLLRSGLVLAGANRLGEEGDAGGVEDGWVTAAEISLMDLRGTKLVVLSACDTGRGEVRPGEGLSGLRRAFEYAGARALVTSLFKVPDAETRQMMERFYGSLRAGQGKLEALNQARGAMRESRRRQVGAAHPLFWAGFVLAGDPR